MPYSPNDLERVVSFMGFECKWFVVIFVPILVAIATALTSKNPGKMWANTHTHVYSADFAFGQKVCTDELQLWHFWLTGILHTRSGWVWRGPGMVALYAGTLLWPQTPVNAKASHPRIPSTLPPSHQADQVCQARWGQPSEPYIMQVVCYRSIKCKLWESCQAS